MHSATPKATISLTVLQTKVPARVSPSIPAPDGEPSASFRRVQPVLPQRQYVAGIAFPVLFVLRVPADGRHDRLGKRQLGPWSVIFGGVLAQVVTTPKRTRARQQYVLRSALLETKEQARRPKPQGYMCRLFFRARRND